MIGTGRQIDGDSDIKWFWETEVGESDTVWYREIDR